MIIKSLSVLVVGCILLEITIGEVQGVININICPLCFISSKDINSQK